MSGIPQAVLSMEGRAGAACRLNMEEGFMKERFIPAELNGEPVQSIYAEAFFIDAPPGH